MFQVEHWVKEQFPRLQQHPWLLKSTTRLFKGLLHERQIQDFAARYPALRGLEFVEQALDYFQFSFSARDSELDHIPARGRVVIIANHPIGSLDGLALLKLVGAVRPDVKIVANQLLEAVTPLKSMLIPVAVFGGSSARNQLEAVYRHIQNEGAVLIFPAGEVSRLRPQGIRDTCWNPGFLKFARRMDAPVLPIYIDAQNSPWFYGVSMLYKPLATALLVQEMFRQQARHINFRIGELIPTLAFRNEAYHPTRIPLRVQAKLFRRHLYRIGQNRRGVFSTQKAIARAESKDQLKHSLAGCECLGTTHDGMQILWYRYQENSPILREIGRLRELTFRAVGEGTGKRRDLDTYDTYYDQLILWSPDDLEIVGAYRLGNVAQIIASHGIKGLYTSSLFDYTDAMLPHLPQGLELGRSFVQPRYWGKRALDYLWQGIGAVLRRHPEYRYLFGAVTLSNDFSSMAKAELVSYFAEHYPPAGVQAKVKEKLPFLQRVAPANSLMELKQRLSSESASIPTLFKQYADLCDEGGVEFLGFNIDPDFANAIDGLVLVDLTKLKAKKYARYVSGRSILETIE